MNTLIRRSAPYLVIFFIATLATGCLSSRRILSVNDHPTKPGTVLQTRDVYSIATIYPVRVVKQFWQCSEKGDQLRCEQICGGDRDLACPTGFANDTRFRQR